MFHQCCNIVGGCCSCDQVIHHGTPFSILFPMSTKTTQEEDDQDNIISSSTVVDCTLSLGTPSTRHIDSTRRSQHVHSSNNIKPSFCSWDFFSHSTKNSSTTHHHHASTTTTTTTSCLGADPLLLARRCANCDTTSTPLWRNGPRGPKSLCNACGIRYKKEERRAAAASSKGTGMSMNFSGDDDKSSYLSWRLNVVPRDNRTSLFQYQ